MGFKAWSKLSVLVLTSAALVGCSNGPQKSGGLIGQQKTNPPVSGLANQNQKSEFPNAGGQGNLSPFAQQNSNLLPANQQQQLRQVNTLPTSGPGPGVSVPTPPNLNNNGFLPPNNVNPPPMPFPGQTNPNSALPGANQSVTPISLPAPPVASGSTTFGTGRDSMPSNLFPPPPQPR